MVWQGRLSEGYQKGQGRLSEGYQKAIRRLSEGYQNLFWCGRAGYQKGLLGFWDALQRLVKNPSKDFQGLLKAFQKVF